MDLRQILGIIISSEIKKEFSLVRFVFSNACNQPAFAYFPKSNLRDVIGMPFHP